MRPSSRCWHITMNESCFIGTRLPENHSTRAPRAESTDNKNPSDEVGLLHQPAKGDNTHIGKCRRARTISAYNTMEFIQQPKIPNINCTTRRAALSLKTLCTDPRNIQCSTVNTRAIQPDLAFSARKRFACQTANQRRTDGNQKEGLHECWPRLHVKSLGMQNNPLSVDQ